MSISFALASSSEKHQLKYSLSLGTLSIADLCGTEDPGSFNFWQQWKHIKYIKATDMTCDSKVLNQNCCQLDFTTLSV